VIYDVEFRLGVINSHLLPSDSSRRATRALAASEVRYQFTSTPLLYHYYLRVRTS